MNIRYTIVAALIAAAAYVSAGSASAQPVAETAGNLCPVAPIVDPICPVVPPEAVNPLVGWWHHKATLTRCDNPAIVIHEFEAELLFHADGTLVSVDNNPPAARQGAVGVWEQRGPRRYLWRMQFNRFNADGSFDGAQDVRADMRLDESGNLAMHTSKVRVLNADGSVRAQVCESGPSSRMGLE